MSFSPYVTFDGNCAEALNFYAEVFGGEADIVQTVGQSPMAAQFGDDQQDQVMHGQFRIGGQVIMGSDSLMAPYQRPGGFHIQVSYTDVDTAKRVFDRLARNGDIRMTFEPTYFSPGFGMCSDRYGVPWMIVCEAETA